MVGEGFTMRTSVRAALSIFLLASTTLYAQELAPPHMETVARVKNHFHRSGELVEGEEDMRKIIVNWKHYPKAAAYQVCHMCDMDKSGVRLNEERGTVVDIEVGHECGGNPCMVLPGAPLGINSFSVRAQVGEEWTPWSDQRNFDTRETGQSQHEEL